MTTIDIGRAQEVRIVTAALTGTTWPDILNAFLAFSGWPRSGGAGMPRSVFHYSECLSACTFERCTEADLSTWTPPEDALEGRVFGGNAELRWHRVGTSVEGGLVAWALRELREGDDDSGSLRATRVDRPYYLIGRADEAGLFHEALYPHVVFRHPVAPDANPEPGNARAFVTVAEYYRATPTWAELSSDDIDAVLAMPLLAQHRFVAVDVGA